MSRRTEQIRLARLEAEQAKARADATKSVGQIVSGKQERQLAFLAAYVELGTVLGASKRVGVSRRLHYQWLEDEAYEELFQVAHAEMVELVEQELRRRALSRASRSRSSTGASGWPMSPSTATRCSCSCSRLRRPTSTGRRCSF